MSDKWTFDDNNQIMLQQEMDRPVNREIAPFLYNHNGAPCVYILEPHYKRSIYRVPCDYKYWPLYAEMELVEHIRYESECENDEYEMWDESEYRTMHVYIPFHASDYESYWWNCVERESFDIYQSGPMSFMRVVDEDGEEFLLPLDGNNRPLPVPEKK